MSLTKDEDRDLYQMVTTIRDKVSRIEFILDSDEKTNKKGAIEDLSDVKKRLYAVENKQANFQYKIATQVGMIVSIFLVASWVIDKIWKYFISK